MSDPAVLAMRSKIRLLPSAELTAARPARQAIVEIERIGKETVRHHAKAVRGTPDNPMEVPEIVAKAEDLISPVMGKARAEALIAAVLALDTLETVRDIGPLLSLQDSGQ
jgi:2-methylcitrate dehydratase PrpD